jgi:N-succinyldiaminopimelate aminotransferase
VIELAERHDFVVASDECYSEIYLDEAQPPAGLLQAAARMGRDDYRRCLVFHSLSKRSSVPGLRSGFVAGDADLIRRFTLYRTYHGCTMPPPTQAASVAAWSDEQHVRENRALYRQKFDAVLAILRPVLEVDRPAASFYLWPRTPLDDTFFARELFRTRGVTVLPGSFLSRESAGINPGSRRVRMALVAPIEDCIEAAHRIHAMLEQGA